MVNDKQVEEAITNQILQLSVRLGGIHALTNKLDNPKRKVIEQGEIMKSI